MVTDREEELVNQAREGSRASFAELLRLHQAHVRAYIGGYVRQPEIVEDLAQETFLTAYRKLDTFRAESPFRIWLLAIAGNTALMHLRSDERRRSHERESLRSVVAGWLAERMESGGENFSLYERRTKALEVCIKSLPQASAALVTDYYLRERTTTEIARETGKHQGAVLRALSRIRQALRRCIELRVGTEKVGP